MKEKRTKFHALGEILFSSRTDLQGKKRYLQLPLYILIVVFAQLIVLFVKEHLSHEEFQLFLLIEVLILSLLILAGFRYERRKHREPNA